MVLAAGLGTRLGSLTRSRPKALAEVAGRTLLDITLARLRSVGISEVVINVHHFAELIVRYLDANKNFGMHIEISSEEVLLDTGGGLKKARDFFLRGAADLDEPLLLHNVDVVSAIDLGRAVELHRQLGALATLPVQKRHSSRYLLFDDAGQLCGRELVREQKTEMARPAERFEALAFSGIHIISPRLLGMMEEEGVFSIISTYLRLASKGARIIAFRADEYYWRDLGKPEDLEQAEADVRDGRIALL
jgi:NDP-sugar pyrophosphorylase family protein